jgi:hypothetical protein
VWPRRRWDEYIPEVGTTSGNRSRCEPAVPRTSRSPRHILCGGANALLAGIFGERLAPLLPRHTFQPENLTPTVNRLAVGSLAGAP